MEKTITKESIYDGAILHVRKDTAELDDGSVVDREVVEHPGGVGIALEDTDNSDMPNSRKPWNFLQERKKKAKIL